MSYELGSDTQHGVAAVATEILRRGMEPAKEEVPEAAPRPTRRVFHADIRPRKRFLGKPERLSPIDNPAGRSGWA
jgi:hypothetical protein